MEPTSTPLPTLSLPAPAAWIHMHILTPLAFSLLGFWLLSVPASPARPSLHGTPSAVRVRRCAGAARWFCYRLLPLELHKLAWKTCTKLSKILRGRSPTDEFPGKTSVIFLMKPFDNFTVYLLKSDFPGLAFKAHYGPFQLTFPPFPSSQMDPLVGMTSNSTHPGVSAHASFCWTHCSVPFRHV